MEQTKDGKRKNVGRRVENIVQDMRRAVFVLHVHLGVLVSLFVYSSVSFSFLKFSKSRVRVFN